MLGRFSEGRVANGETDPSIHNRTAFCNSELEFLAQFRNLVYTISFTLHVRGLTDESDIVLPHCKMLSNYLIIILP